MSYSKIWDSKELSEALNIRIADQFSAGKIEFNSREISEGDIFIALEGGKNDSHNYIEDAFKKGAKAAIISKNIALQDRILLKVENTNQALINLANYKRAKSKAKFIGITGSVGKTSTKEIISFLLSDIGSTFSNKGNYNNHIGVPLSLCSLSQDHEYSVNEMGMSAKGEISYLTNLVKPDIAIITKIAPAHLEFFDSVRDICLAKSEIFDSVKPDAIAILNRDDEFYDLQKSIAESKNIKNIYSFGEHEDSDARLVKYELEDDKSKILLEIDGQKLDLTTSVTGKHQALNICLSLLVISRLGLDPFVFSDIIKKLGQVNGRGKIFEINIDGKNLKIIDDAYNANPASVAAALENLRYSKGRKVAVLGDMLELGKDAAYFHESLEKNLIDSEVSLLFTFGKLMAHLSNKIESRIENYSYDTANNDYFHAMIPHLQDGDVILVKGSRSTKISSFIDYLMEMKQN